MTNPRRPSLVRGVVYAALVVFAAGGAFLIGKSAAEGPNEQVAPPARGLPHTPDYHALYVDPDDAEHLLLGTHVGIYVSRDAGATWAGGPLEGDDAMNIVRTPDGSLWVAGHNVLTRSEDRGRTWSDVRPDGLPHLDLHGFATDPGGRLYAAAAGEGLYASSDGGVTYVEVTQEVGGSVYGLLALGDGRLLAADSRRGVLVSDDRGETWRVVLEAPVIRLGASPADPDLVLATGERIWRSTDGGETFDAGFEPGMSFEPVAWSSGTPAIAIAITPQTRTLYRSDDGGEDWAPVG